MTQKNKYLIPFIALTSLFFMWGLITVVVDAFIPRLKEVFELSYAKAGLVQVAWFLAYFLISIPGGILVSKVGYKKGIIGGLLIAGLGCLLFIPAASTRMYVFFLLALFTLASGITVLQVAANPFVAVLGPEEKASSRLNLAQAFNSLGTTLGPIIAAAYLLSDSIKSSDQIALLSATEKEFYFSSEASAVQIPFLVIGGVLAMIALIFALVKLPNILKTDTDKKFLDALKFNHLKLGVIAIFLYVGAEVAIGSYLVNYFMELNLDQSIPQNGTLNAVASFISEVFKGQSISEIDGKAIVGTFVLFYWGGAMIGRFIGSYLTSIFKANKVLSIFAIGAIVLCLLTMLNTGFIAMWTVLLVGFFNSIMFPTIFSLSIEGLEDYKPQGSGLLCTAIFGGAVIPFLFGLCLDVYGFSLAFLLPILCYVYIAYYGYKGYVVSND